MKKYQTNLNRETLRKESVKIMEDKEMALVKRGSSDVRWHHQPGGHEFEQTPGDSEGQGSLACCSPQGRKESDTTSTTTTKVTGQLLQVAFLHIPPKK